MFVLLLTFVSVCNAFSVRRTGLPAHYVRRSRVVTCGWGPEPIWSTRSISTIEEAASGLVSIKVLPADDVAAGFTTPGQYVQIRQPGAEKAGFFAIASAPSEKECFDFLIKEAPPSDWSPGTSWLTGASAGTPLEMSQVMGSGFKIGADALSDVDSVVCFAAGSGISPIRSAIESGMLKGKKVSLYYGARTPAQMAYQHKFESWKRMGVSVTAVISRPDGTGWSGATGYVQDIARSDGLPSRCAILLCGMKGMAEAVKALATDAGVPPEKVLTNF